MTITQRQILPLFLTVTACAMPPVPQDGEGSGTGATADSDADSGGDASGGDASGDDEISECLPLGAKTEGLLRELCSGCHDNGQTNGGLGGISNLDGLINGGYVSRGNAADSILFKRIDDGGMPLNGPALTSEQRDVVKAWIDTCTDEEVVPEDTDLDQPPACPKNAPIPQQKVLKAIRDDLIGLDDARARTTRYLTLSHLYGAGYCEGQIEGYRHALAKLLNSLSNAPDVRTPRAIDEARTIYRIDLTDYKWSKETWANITAADPYAINFLSEDARDIQLAAEVELFSVKADWFVDSASQPPLYHTILEIPENRFLLEQRLGVDVQANIDDELLFNNDDLVRAGFKLSKVSDFNRVIERHQQPTAGFRAYWLSYDFGSNNGVKSIFDNPLDFQEDGGEIIFNLPNGLQAYMLVDAKGTRLDRGPINIVHDQETREEPEVINGLSCMSCHSEGMRLATDEVAQYVAGNTLFDELAQADVAKLYAASDVFARKQQQDLETFANAMELTGAPRRVGDHEPIMAAHLAFELPLDLRRAAAEFGVPETEVLKNVSKLQGLSSIDRLTVDRETFQANFAANACVLKLGVTTACPLVPN